MVIGASTIFSAGELPAMFRLLGRCHSAVVHFPIAMVVVAAALESWQLLRRKPELARATPTCLSIGAVSAIVASLFGWFLNQSEDGGGELADIHTWAGLLTTAAAIIALALVRVSSRRAVLRLTIIAAACLASTTGYLGGELVFGQNHLFKGVFDERSSEVPGFAAVASSEQATRVQEANQLTPSVAEHSIDFTTEVVPILKDNCLRCHGGDKVKGKLSLKTKSRAMKGGASGLSILPGQGENSPLYILLVESKPDARMPPPKEKQLSAQQIELIRKWINQGAAWPDNYELR